LKRSIAANSRATERNRRPDSGYGESIAIFDRIPRRPGILQIATRVMIRYPDILERRVDEQPRWRRPHAMLYALGLGYGVGEIELKLVADPGDFRRCVQ
jgi:hypothetical protein